MVHCGFPIGLLDQVWHLIVSIPDLCTFTYLHFCGIIEFGPYFVVQYLVMFLFSNHLLGKRDLVVFIFIDVM